VLELLLHFGHTIYQFHLPTAPVMTEAQLAN